MQALRLVSTALLFSCGFLRPSAIARCPDPSLVGVGPGSPPNLGSAPTVTGQGGADDRIVDLTLVLRKSGAVRDAPNLRTRHLSNPFNLERRGVAGSSEIAPRGAASQLLCCLHGPFSPIKKEN